MTAASAAIARTHRGSTAPHGNRRSGRSTSRYSVIRCLLLPLLLAGVHAQASAVELIGDRLGPSRSAELEGFFVDTYLLHMPPGTGELQLDLRSEDFDTYLIVEDGSGRLFENDDFGSTTRSFVELRDPGSVMLILVTSYSSGETGDYTLELISPGTLERTDDTALEGPAAASIRERSDSASAPAMSPSMPASQPTFPTAGSPAPPPRPTSSGPGTGASAGSGGATGGRFPASRPTTPESPSFPWPPPHASATTVLRRDLFESGDSEPTRLGDIDGQLTTALDEAGYREKSYYETPGGFALVTRVERIDDEAYSLDVPARWDTNVPPLREFSISAYIRALFGATVGRFRLLVFITSSQPFSQSEERIDLAEGLAILREGTNVLQPVLADAPYTDDHRVTVLVYEFEKVRADADSRTSVRLTSRFDASSHLTRAGVQPELER